MGTRPPFLQRKAVWLSLSSALSWLTKSHTGLKNSQLLLWWASKMLRCQTTLPPFSKIEKPWWGCQAASANLTIFALYASVVRKEKSMRTLLWESFCLSSKASMDCISSTNSLKMPMYSHRPWLFLLPPTNLSANSVSLDGSSKKSLIGSQEMVETLSTWTSIRWHKACALQFKQSWLSIIVCWLFLTLRESTTRSKTRQTIWICGSFTCGCKSHSKGWSGLPSSQTLSRISKVVPSARLSILMSWMEARPPNNSSVASWRKSPRQYCRWSKHGWWLEK